MTSNMTRDLEDMIHAHGVIPSLTVLGALMLDRETLRHGPLSEADEIDAMKVTEAVSLLGTEILVFSKVRQLDGRPTVLVSLRRFPHADIGFVADHLRPLNGLGSKTERRDALEIAVAEELRKQLPGDHRVTLRPNEFHHLCNDIVVIAPHDRLFNIEARNWRADVHDRLKPVDRDALVRGSRSGITMIFVVPRCTRRFRRITAELGGVVVETETYLVSTEAKRNMLSSFSWMTRLVELSEEAAPRIAGQLVPIILDGYVETEADMPFRGRSIEETPDTMSKKKAKSEIARLTSRRRSEMRLDKADELCRSGVTTMERAAKALGWSRRTLLRDYEKTGRPSPWPRGGRRS